ncbi:hypothetical protein M8998_03865 [Sphingobacterium sp. lm-10]|uniref:hypothetical protein n=1 Tax=Sphingobacterium sp. lm-10 TaxID=2944904 RepID=UPI002020DF5A|nr:hypothetical protein [Sphingobacterium sp. lm-10]MCL7987075.1 hypothetical protein [Sphingobacterium sp. lm-10]
MVCTVAVFVLLTTLFTVVFIMKFSFGAKIGMATLHNIVIERAIYLTIPIAIAYWSIHNMIIHVRHFWTLMASIVLILIGLSAVLYYFYLFYIVVPLFLENPFVD